MLYRQALGKKTVKNNLNGVSYLLVAYCELEEIISIDAMTVSHKPASQAVHSSHIFAAIVSESLAELDQFHEILAQANTAENIETVHSQCHNKFETLPFVSKLLAYYVLERVVTQGSVGQLQASRPWQQYGQIQSLEVVYKWCQNSLQADDTLALQRNVELLQQLMNNLLRSGNALPSFPELLRGRPTGGQ